MRDKNTSARLCAKKAGGGGGGGGHYGTSIDICLTIIVLAASVI